MSLKLKDFAKSDIKSEKISVDNDSDEDICYLPPSSGNGWRTESSNAHYDDVPRLNDEKPLFGPNLNGNIQVTYPSMIDGYAVDGNQMQAMESLGLPTGFSLRMDGQEKQRKGDKKTFYCQICLIELNSLDTMRSHVKGVKHMKKKLQLDAQREEKINKGELIDMDSAPTVIPIPNPESTKKKIPIRLHEKIRETRDPVVGLEFIKEWIAVSDAEMEPHYECELCGNQGIANGMFSHIMGHKHRQKFVDEVYKDDPARVMDLSQGDLLKYARKHNENGSDLKKLIRTRMSDEEYPWPPGKAPWAIEKGGTGIPPDGARENWGKNKHYSREDVKPVVISQVYPEEKPRPNVGTRGGGSGGLPSVESLRNPKDENEAIKMVKLGERLLTMGLEFSSSRLSHIEQATLSSLATALVTKMLTKRGMRPSTSNGHHSPPRVRPPSDSSMRLKRSRERNSRSPSPKQNIKRERRSSSREDTRMYSERERSYSRQRSDRESYRNDYEHRRYDDHDDRDGRDYRNHVNDRDRDYRHERERRYSHSRERSYY